MLLTVCLTFKCSIAIAAYSCVSVIKFRYIQTDRHIHTHIYIYTSIHPHLYLSMYLSIHLLLYKKSSNVWKWQSDYKNFRLCNTYSLGLVPQEKIFWSKINLEKTHICIFVYASCCILVSFYSSGLYNVLRWNYYFIK